MRPAAHDRVAPNMLSPNAKRETTVAEEKLEGIRRDAKRSDGFLEATTEGLAFHDVLGDVGTFSDTSCSYRGIADPRLNRGDPHPFSRPAAAPNDARRCVCTCSQD